VVSTRDASLASFRRGLVVLDEIARIKRSDAIICDAVNRRISARLLARWGWEPLGVGKLHRRYVKRFYGKYPARPEVWGEILSPERPAATCEPSPASAPETVRV
jgi:hypothetical protein